MTQADVALLGVFMLVRLHYVTGGGVARSVTSSARTRSCIAWLIFSRAPDRPEKAEFRNAELKVLNTHLNTEKHMLEGRLESPVAHNTRFSAWQLMLRKLIATRRQYAKSHRS